MYFKSSVSAKHSSILVTDPCIAGTIQPDKLNRLVVKGIQFEGKILPGDHPICKEASADYYKKHPMALAVPGEIWVIELNKMTDSTLGFGKKISWKRNETVSIS
jgi:uncharacterized protein YhbP (UPF0306 family)